MAFTTHTGQNEFALFRVFRAGRIDLAKTADNGIYIISQLRLTYLLAVAFLSGIAFGLIGLLYFIDFPDLNFILFILAIILVILVIGMKSIREETNKIIEESLKNI